MVVAAAGGALAGREVVAGVVGQQRRHRIEHRDLDVLPAARRLPGVEREEDPLGGHHPRREVRDGGSDARRRPVRLAGQIHQPGLALHDQVVAGAVRVGPAGAEPRDRTVDHPRMPRRNRRVVEAEPGDGAGPEVLDDDVGARDQPPRDGPARVVLEVDGAAPLVAVDREVVGRLAREKRRTERAGLVAAPRLLDLDDVGPHVAEGHRAVGAGHHPAEIDDPNAVERRATVPARPPVAAWRVRLAPNQPARRPRRSTARTPSSRHPAFPTPSPPPAPQLVGQWAGGESQDAGAGRHSRPLRSSSAR